MKRYLLILFIILFVHSCTPVVHNFNHQSIKCPLYYGQSIQHKISVSTFAYNPPGNGTIGQNEITVTGSLDSLMKGYSSLLFDNKISNIVSNEIEKALQSSGIEISEETKCLLSGEVFLLNFSSFSAHTISDIKYVLKNDSDQILFEARLKIKHNTGVSELDHERKIIEIGKVDQLLAISIHKNVYKLLSMNTFIDALSKCSCNE